MVELNHTIVWCKDQKRSSASASAIGTEHFAHFTCM